MLSSDIKVGDLATEHPLATRVFARHGIDYCCGGGIALTEACEKKGLETEAVLAEIQKELDSATATEERWDQAPLEDVITHLLTSYHRPLDEELPRLMAMSEKVLQVHEDKAPEMLRELVSVYRGLKTELEQHMAKEEQILFPMIQRGQGAMAGGPINVMHLEHDNAAHALGRLRELTNDYTVPDEACNTWRALWHGLKALEESLHRHIHLENNVLFPRALGS